MSDNVGKDMKNRESITFIIAMLIIGSVTISTIYLERIRAPEEFDRVFNSGVESGYITGKFTASEFIDYGFYEFYGEVYSIDEYDTFNISDMGTNWVLENGTVFVPYQFIIYKMKLDSCGFSWYDPSPYFSDTNMTCYVSFRYCRDGPITEPGRYKFYFLDVDIMEITHWERV